MSHSITFRKPRSASRIINVLMYPGTILLFLMIFSLTASATFNRPPSRRERAIQANQELRQYHQRLQKEIAVKHQRSVTDVSQDVGIKLNREVATSSNIFFYDNFESSSPTWTTELYGGTTDDIWHLTSSASASPTHSFWAGIENQGNYNTGRPINTALKSPQINLNGAVGSVNLLFAENFVTERGWDYCMVDVSTDGVNWTHLRGGYGPAPSGDSYGWRLTSLDLTPYANQTIQIRFYFDTGDSVLNNFPGWYVDDIIVFDQGGFISGRKFFDVNNNGVKDPGERGVKDWMITASGPVTLTAKTDYRGHYRLPLPLGTYTVTEAFEPNWTQKYPLAGHWNINLATADTLIDSLFFGNYTQASFINGIAFHDLNQDGSFNTGDTLLPNWKILLSDTSGNVLDYDFTDSLGQYQLYIFQPGRYVVSEVEKKGWIETDPVAGSYTIDIPDLNTVSNDNNFGTYYSPLTNSILGQKFEDRNRNHLFDSTEGGVAGFKIQLWKKGNGNHYSLYKQKTTDSSGFYQFLSVLPDTYKVSEVPMEGWWQSYPDSVYHIVLDTGATLDSLDFGNYQIVTGSIGGMKFHDINKNAVRDSSEEGLEGWNISLSGTTYFNRVDSKSSITDANGNYTITGLWPGQYVVSEVWKNGWTQTFPINLGVYNVALGPEENRTGIDFGNIDSVYLGKFRTFRMDSLAYSVNAKGAHQPIATKPIKDEFWITLRNNTYQDSAQFLRLEFPLPYISGSLTFSKPGTLIQVSNKYKKIQFDFSPYLQYGDSVTIHGFTLKVKPEGVSAPKWVYNDSTKSIPSTSVSAVNILRLAMPNAVNLLQTVGSIRVGLGGPHSVVSQTYQQMVTSLFDLRHGPHTGDARCLDTYSGSTHPSIKRQQSSLPPTKHNNKLFAELIAFNVNINASDEGKTPHGFGNLVYDEGTSYHNPMNGLTLREIAAKADSFMSSYKDTIGLKFCHMPEDFGIEAESLYQKIHNIDSAFSGPIDTISWSGNPNLLQFTGIRQLADVSFLRFDSSRVQPVSFKSNALAQVPEQFTLYQNYPNPFNPTTTLSFNLTERSVVTLKVYNLLGQEVATVLNRQVMDIGNQEISFDASALSSGVYFYQLRADILADQDNGIAAQTLTAVKKMVLIK